MTTEDAHFRLRLPEDLHAQLIEVAEKNQRSINAEIVARLKASLRWEAHDPDEMARYIDDLDRRMALVFKHLKLWDSGYDPRDQSREEDA